VQTPAEYWSTVMAFRPRLTSLAVVATLAAGSLSALPASAALVANSPSVAFSDSASVTDYEGGGATTTSNALGTSSIEQFNPSLGVLMGATLNLTSTRTQTVTVTAASGRDNGNNNTQTTTGSGWSAGALSAPGVTATFSSPSLSASCTGGRLSGCGPSTSETTTTTNALAAVAAGSLDDYVGSETVTVERSASLSAYQKAPQFKGEESTTYALTWDGTLSATYEYLQHAAPSFASDSLLLELTHNFGTLALGADASWSFDMFNLPADDRDRVGLDLDSLSASGDFGKFLLTGLSAFTGLGAGESYGYSVDFDTSTPGTFLASYRFTLSDADVGAEASRHRYLLTLNLQGAVANPQREVRNSVPEPGSLALLLGGLAGVIATRRRRLPA
jgi:hypothetical protein